MPIVDGETRFETRARIRQLACLAKFTVVQLMLGNCGVERDGDLVVVWFGGNEVRKVCALRTMFPTTPGMEEAVPATAFMVAFRIEVAVEGSAIVLTCSS
jgi:hypothetical protein